MPTIPVNVSEYDMDVVAPAPVVPSPGLANQDAYSPVPASADYAASSVVLGLLGGSLGGLLRRFRHRHFLAAVTTSTESKSFKDAINDPGWRQGMHNEIRSLEDNDTWRLEPLPPGKKDLASRWVYKVKFNYDGSVERLKARLMVFSNHQVEGIDYSDTFTPVAKLETLRAFLIVAAVNNWELHQMDVHNAFLHGDLDEEVYMRVPPGFSRGKPVEVYHLLKSLYGLKQAPRCWFSKLSTTLKKYDFIQSLYL
ncbi:transmembrane signal receptor [Lithospermum erythrorhizon]|uniref:Transmembrane signal receptor n=1 Tax=Lithospermum erythrorhizon TaxID=34254 RepID=A0AAV3P7P0_LITER